MKKGIMQHDLRDCGAACLATILKQYNSFVPLIEIRNKMKVTRNGTNILAITQVAEDYGLCTEAYEATYSELVEAIEHQEIRLPMIAHLHLEDGLQHFVVIWGLSNLHIRIFDPAKGEKKLSLKTFIEQWSGHIITFDISSEFIPRKREYKSYLKFIKIITTQKKLFFIAIVCSLILAAVSIMCSLGYQIIIDKYILGVDSQYAHIPLFSDLFQSVENVCRTLSGIFVALIGIYLCQSLIYLVQGYVVTKIYVNSSRTLFSKFYTHMIKLPIPFFYDRETGEVISRYNDVEEIQSAVCGIGLNFVINFIMAAAGTYVLYSIQPRLFGIVVLTTFFYTGIVLIYRYPIRNVSRDIMEENSHVTSKLKEAVDGIETIKAFHAEEKFQDVLTEKTEEYVGKREKGMLISISQSTLLITMNKKSS